MARHGHRQPNGEGHHLDHADAALGTAGGELSGPPAEIAGVIRHGYVPANTILPGVSRVSALQNGAFLLDVDIYVAATQPFDPEALVEQITMFHDQLDRFFHWTLTAAGELYFGLEEVE